MKHSTFFLNTHPVLAGLILLGSMALLAPQEASAVPAFARQAEMPCTACHFQHFPALNSFGREFRAGGYTLTGGQELISDDGLSLPSVLNASVVAKLRYNKTNGNTKEDTDHGAIQWPDEAALLIGGRLAENAGFLMELGLAGVDTGNSFFSTKLHFNVAELDSTRLSVIPFSTDGLGAGYGFELLNTGAQRSQRPIESRKGFSAAQALGLGSGEATGIALVASSSDYFINYSPWVPGWSDENTTVKVSGLAHYLRAAYTPAIGDWDTGFGVQYWSGDATAALNDGSGDTVDIKTDGWIVDFQAQGDVGLMPLGLYASYGSCQGDAGHFAGSCQNADDATAYGLLAQLGVMPDKANVYVAYRSMDVGTTADADFNAVTLGANYLYASNVRFELFFEKESGSGVDARTTDRDRKIIFQMFAGF